MAINTANTRARTVPRHANPGTNLKDGKMGPYVAFFMLVRSEPATSTSKSVECDFVGQTKIVQNLPDFGLHCLCHIRAEAGAKFDSYSEVFA